MSKQLMAENIGNLIHFQNQLLIKVRGLRGEGPYSDPALALFSIVWQALGPKFSISQIKEVYDHVKELIPLELLYLFHYPLLSSRRATLSSYVEFKVLSFLGVKLSDLVSLLSALHYNSDIIYYMILAKERRQGGDYTIPYERLFSRANAIFHFERWENKPSLLMLEESYRRLCSGSGSLKECFEWNLTQADQLGPIPRGVRGLYYDSRALADYVSNPEPVLSEWKCKQARHYLFCKYLPVLAMACASVVSISFIVISSIAIAGGGQAAGEYDDSIMKITLLLFLAVPSTCGLPAFLVLQPKGLCLPVKYTYLPLLPEGILIDREQQLAASVDVVEPGIELSQLEEGLLAGNGRRPRRTIAKAVTIEDYVDGLEYGAL